LALMARTRAGPWLCGADDGGLNDGVRTVEHAGALGVMAAGDDPPQPVWPVPRPGHQAGDLDDGHGVLVGFGDHPPAADSVINRPQLIQ
jgi:hypothetical protein